MKKTQITAVFIQQIRCSKTFKIIRNTLLLLILNVFQMFAVNTYSQTTTLTLSLNDVTLKEVSLQPRLISGTVQDNNGLPLPGVAIIVKETTIGSITDTNGRFSLQVPADAQILVFSFIGMKSLEVDISDQAVFNIIMEEAQISLDEVVVVGYGTVKKANLLTSTRITL